MKDTEFLFLTAMLRAREARMLSKGKIERMLDAQSFDDAAKILTDCGYPDVSGMSVNEAENVLAEHRQKIFYELSEKDESHALADIFRIKYDYHNVKVLAKSMIANVDASGILSKSGRIDQQVLTEAFISGERQFLPPAVSGAISEAVGILSRTRNPQMADIAVDKAYFGEISAIANETGDEFTVEYVRLLIDSANLRTLVRAQRTSRDLDFIKTALIPGGSADGNTIISLHATGASLSDIFSNNALGSAAALGAEVMAGGEQTQFELACDNAVMYYVSGASLKTFGPGHVLAYLAELEWEITAVRMILTGKHNAIAPEVIRERLRERYV